MEDDGVRTSLGKATACLHTLEHLMAPAPGSVTVALARFAQAVAKKAEAEACSVYLLADDDHGRLELSGAFGYHEHLDASVHYRTDDPKAFTTSVFHSGEAQTRRAEDLPSVARCKAFLKSGEFRNVAAVAIVFQHGKNRHEKLGVLKLENHKEAFTQEHLEFLQLVANFLALAIQQRKYADSWGEALRRPKEQLLEYATRLTMTLAKLFYSDLAFIFLRTASESFREVGHWGLAKSDPLRSQVNRLVNLAAASGVEIPFRGDGADGPLGNALVIPILRENMVRGVLVAGSLLPTDPSDAYHFDAYHVKVARAFAHHISTGLSEDVSNRPQTPGLDVLVKAFGKPIKTRGMSLRKRVRDVVRKRSESTVRITGEDCAAYLQISRTYFLKLAQEPAVDDK